MTLTLKPNGNPITIEGMTLRTPGLEGRVTAKRAALSGKRARQLSERVLMDTFSEQEVMVTAVLELSGTKEVPLGQSKTRSTRRGEPAIELEVKAPSAGWEQVVLCTDEHGIATWSFAEPAPGGGPEKRGSGERRTYRIRRHTPDQGPPNGRRGLIGAIGKKILMVVAFKAIEAVGGELGSSWISRWEHTHRPYRLRTFDPDTFAGEGSPLDPGAWPTLQSGRALLMVHGTASSSRAAFGDLPSSFVVALHERYQGRVFAFDHPTLSEDPRQNVEWLATQLPRQGALDLDIVCHSRGGLVSRYLWERSGSLDLGELDLKIARIVMVAVPNSGTILADTKHMATYVDVVTTLLNLFPDNGVTDVLATLVTVVKAIACGITDRLRGLQAMHPAGDFLKSLNQGPAGPARYFALESAFEPLDLGLESFADMVMDTVFGEENDLVVPTAGVSRDNGSRYFPIAEQRRHTFPTTRGIPHTGFFGKPECQQKILEWLS